MTAPAPGVCLTFDDLFVDNWLAAQPVFDAFSARTTLCVSHLHTATPEQIRGLHALQDHGHEIGFHSRTHPRLKPYLQRHGLDHWLAHEIDAGIAEHRAQGFPATSFASPFHASTPETRRATASRFAVTRAHGPRGVTPETVGSRIYRAPDADRAVHAIGSLDFQHPVQGGWDWLSQILDRLVARKGVGVFIGHNITQTENGRGFYSTQAQLHRVLDEICTRGLQFHTLTGFACATPAGDIAGE